MGKKKNSKNKKKETFKNNCNMDEESKNIDENNPNNKNSHE